MQSFYRILTLATFGILFAGVAAGQSYTASLDGLQEVPPTPSAGTGTGTLFIDAQSMGTVHIEFSGLGSPVTAAHIHSPAPPGQNAAVRFSLIPPQPPSSPIDIVVGPFTAQDLADLNNGLMYFNIHTEQFPGGEIRGQIAAVGTPVAPSTWGEIKALYNE